MSNLTKGFSVKNFVCSDIHYLGRDGTLFKDCLMNIFKNPKYRSAVVQ